MSVAPGTGIVIPARISNSEAYIYQYFFYEKLYMGWSWSERFPGQPEIERWMHYITDQLDLRKDIQFNTTVQRAHSTRRRSAGRC